jgi:Na+/H+ antiporter NhaC
MQNISEIINIIGYIFATGLVAIGFLGFKKMLKEISKSNDDDFLSEIERKKLLRYSIYMVIGGAISIIISLIKFMSLFFNNLL